MDTLSSLSVLQLMSRKSPYYILSYDYKEESSGVRVLHYLCHFLRRLGYEAYVTGKKRSPKLDTPELTDTIILEHQKNGLIPIRVYPEVLLNDPLPFGVTARYLLNKPGYFLNKHSIGDDELIFFYIEMYNIWPGRGSRLCLPATDPLLFYPRTNSKRNRSGFAVYMNHYITRGGVLDQRFKSGIEISKNNPVDYSDLPDLFNKISVLYAYEIGAHVNEARMCGCPVVLIKNDISLNDIEDELSRVYFPEIGVSIENAEIGEQVVSNVCEFYGKYVSICDDYISDILKFIDITQEKAEELSAKIKKWDENAYLNHYPDVAQAVKNGSFKSGLDHFEKFGKNEGRNNCEISSEAYNQVFKKNNVNLSIHNKIVSAAMDEDSQQYQRWINARQHLVSMPDIKNAAKDMLIHVVMYIEEGEQNLLADSLDAVGGLFYQHWHFSVFSTLPCPNELFEEIPNLDWNQIANENLLADQVNQTIASMPSDWMMLLQSGVTFGPDVFSICAYYINTHKHWRLIYADEDRIDQNHLRHSPCFKPDFNLDLLRSMPYFGETLLIERDAFLTVGGLIGPPGAYAYDLSFKILDQYDEKVFGHISDVLFHSPDIGRFSLEAGRQSLVSHLSRCQITATVGDGYVSNAYWIQYQHIDKPKVSIIIPTKDRLDLLQPCIESLFEKTAYRNFEVIVVDNQSEGQATKDYLKVIQQQHGAQICVIDYPEPYNYSAINNFAARQAKGDYLLLLNNDTVIIQDQWLERMLNHGQREEVGIVGARLVFPNQTIQHAGVILGMGSFGVADHPHISLRMTDPGYMNRAQVVQNFSAVTAACMLIRKSVYFEVGGLDEKNFKVLFNDVDLCLKVRELGYKIVWTPYATVIHHGSSSIKADKNPDKAKRAREEADKMLEKWLPQLANDPAYNRNLSLKHRHFQIEIETDVTWNVDFHERPRVYAFPANDSGIGEYRVRAPLRALTHAAMIESSLLPNHSATLIPDIVEIERVKPDTLLLQNGTADYLIHAWQQYRKFNDVFMIYSQDDLVHMLPGKHPLQAKWPKDVRRRLSKLMEHSDRLIVATEPLREAYSKYISDIKLVPNYLEKARWLDLKPNKQIRNSRKLRVGWAGGGQHHGDLEFIAPVIEATKDEVDWVFMGMCLDQIRPYVKEYHAGVAFDLYPQKLADLDLDLAIAPLEYNNFNMAKTNLRLLEYGILGWPVLCSDITPYQGAPVTLVGNNVKHWLKAIREKIHEPEALLKEGQALQQWVLSNYLLEDHLDEWLAALTP
jgi:GT2 family glycosyltransferase